MSAGSSLNTLLRSNMRSWIGAKGFWLVAAAALLPLVLTGAWVAGHRADVQVSDITIEGAPFTQGQEARFSATVTNVGKTDVGAFNFSLAVGEVQGGALFPAENQVVAIEALAPGESRDVTLLWNATPGVVYALATADPEDEIGERDEFNNQKAEPIAVAYRPADASRAPSAPLGLAGDANATTDVDLVVEDLQRPASISPGDNATFSVVVRNNGGAVDNAEVVVRVSLESGGRSIAVREQKQNVSFAAGETKTVELAWTAQEGAFWHEGYALPPAGSRDLFADNNHVAESFAVDPVLTPEMTPPEPEERLTIKDFYLNVLSLLHLRLLLPLIALFYAAGVIADEKERGSLPYLLTRPIPRWLIPITKFAASFLVAALATVVGVVLTYLLLFGTTVEGGDIGYLTTPLLATLVTLFAYGALFILLGTLVERPYLVGIAIVLGWENAAALLVPWVRNFALSTHTFNLISGWPLNEGFQWLPGEGNGRNALFLLLGVGVVALALASAHMRRREFQVG